MEDQNNYCRLCTNEDNLVEMDSLVINCIKNEFSIEIHNNDELSKEICQRCYEFISNLISFKENVARVQKLLQKILKRKDTHVNADVTNENIAHRNVVNEAAAQTSRQSKTPLETEPVEDSTDTNTNSATSEADHNLITKIIKSINLDEIEKTAEKMKLQWNPQNTFCDICKVKVTDNEKFMKHMKSSVHAFKSYIIRKFGEPNIFNKYLVGYTCSICNKIFTSKTILSTHSREEHKVPMNKNNLKPNTLILKSKKSDDVKEDDKEDVSALQGVKVKDEPDIANDDGKKHPCKMCTKRFGFAESLSRHMKKHHKGTHYCVHCGFVTINKRTFATHLRDHYNLTHLQRLCSVCFKVCDSYTDLLNHRKDHEAAILQVCTICHSTFPNSTSLKKHKRDVHRTQTEELPKKNIFKCRSCNRAFMSLLVLEKHQCTAKKYPCLKSCGKRFDSFSRMERHSLKCNWGNTIYSCKKCHKNYKSLRTLKTHTLKCFLEVSSVASTSSTATKIPSVGVESAKKIAQPLESRDEKVPEPCSSQIQPPRNEIAEHRIVSQKNEQSAGSTVKIVHPSVCKKRNPRSVIKKTVLKKSKKLNPKVRKVGINKTQKLMSTIVRDNINTNTSLNNARKEKPMACQTCGLVFKNIDFLKQHELKSHSTSITRSTTEPGTEEKICSNQPKPSQTPVPETDKNLPQQTREQNRPNIQNATIAVEPKTPSRDQAKPPEKDRNIRPREDPSRKMNGFEQRMLSWNTTKPIVPENHQRTHDEDRNRGTNVLEQNKRSCDPVKPLVSENEQNNIRTRDDSNRPHLPNPTHTYERKRSWERSKSPDWRPEIVKNPDTRHDRNRYHTSRPKYDNSTYPLDASRSRTFSSTASYDRTPKTHLAEQNHHRVNKNNRFSPDNSTYPDASRFRKFSNTSSYDRTPKTHLAEQNRYRTNTSNRFSPGYENHHANRRSSNLPPKEVPVSEPKAKQQLEIISPSKSICKICKNTNPHLFCTPCGRCFVQNQNQYFNHMKMKHS